MHKAALWQALFRGWGLFELAIALLTRTRRSTGKVQDRGSMVLLWITIAICITGSIWITYRVPAANFRWTQSVESDIRWAAIALMVVGLAVRATAILQLGRAFSVNVAIHDNQQLQTRGLYRFARHPSYTGMEIIFLALGLYDSNWLSLAIILLPTTAALLYRINVEEVALRGAFGEQYAAYSQRVKRLIPAIY